MFLSVNGVKLYYEVHGSGSPILLVHGNSESHAIFDKLIPALAKNHTVYCADSRGHGQSSAVSEYHYTDMAEDYIELIKTLGIEKPAFYGFSDGGILGLMIAMKEPDLLSSIVCSGPNLWPTAVKKSVLFVLRVICAIKKKPLFEMMLREPDIKPKELSAIACPALITAGTKDLILQDHIRLIADSIPDAELKIFPGETHESYVVHKDLLAPVIEDFIARRVKEGITV
ncbi:MAG TPA: alpha/beta hydrolase [Oscillospiraceae bacterium]|nr:alpha/beta hydrolase [Oscillospiraceae bacterium]HXK77116.1 alpha/beta hydrolase [Oscillospiraceae bacterium]